MISGDTFEDGFFVEDGDFDEEVAWVIKMEKSSGGVDEI